MMLLLCGGAAVPAFAHYPSVAEYHASLTANGGLWDLLDGGDGKHLAKARPQGRR